MRKYQSKRFYRTTKPAKKEMQKLKKVVVTGDMIRILKEEIEETTYDAVREAIKHETLQDAFNVSDLEYYKRLHKDRLKEEVRLSFICQNLRTELNNHKLALSKLKMRHEKTVKKLKEVIQKLYKYEGKPEKKTKEQVPEDYLAIEL